jgi:hypothetical protein
MARIRKPFTGATMPGSFTLSPEAMALLPDPAVEKGPHSADIARAATLQEARRQRAEAAALPQSRKLVGDLAGRSGLVFRAGSAARGEPGRPRDALLYYRQIWELIQSFNRGRQRLAQRADEVTAAAAAGTLVCQCCGHKLDPALDLELDALRTDVDGLTAILGGYGYVVAATAADDVALAVPAGTTRTVRRAQT